MNSMRLESFDSVRMTCRQALQSSLNMNSMCFESLRYFHMDSMCRESFESIQTTCRPALWSILTWIQCVEKVSNLFEPLVDHHYKVLSHGFDVLRKFRISSKQWQTSTIEWIGCVVKVLNLFEPLVDCHYKVLSHGFNVLRKF